MSMLVEGTWLPVRDGDPRAMTLYLRHYSARKARGKQPRTWVRDRQARFMGSGEHMVLLSPDCSALFAWRVQRYRQDGQHGVECTIFRNEGAQSSSALIDEACALAWARWPGQRLFTFVNPHAIVSSNPGYCFLKAGWVRLPGATRKGLRLLERVP